LSACPLLGGFISQKGLAQMQGALFAAIESSKVAIAFSGAG